jgi:helicase MOV-10
MSCSLHSFSCGIEGDPYLRRGRDVRVIVRLCVTEIGRYEDMLEIRFTRVSDNQPFSVTRKVKAIVGDAADYALLRPTAPYVPRQRTNRQAISDWITGVPPPRLLAIAWRSKLRQYQIPPNDRAILSIPPVNTDTGGDIVPAEIRSLLPGTLSRSTHADMFCKLLWLEEISMEYINYLIQL